MRLGQLREDSVSHVNRTSIGNEHRRRQGSEERIPLNLLSFFFFLKGQAPLTVRSFLSSATQHSILRASGGDSGAYLKS